jgi:hypothetical protein
MEARERSSAWKWVWRLVVALTLTFACCVGLVVVAAVVGLKKLGEALEHDTQVSIRQTIANDRVEFQVILGKDVSGIAQFTVRDEEGKELWRLYGTGSVKPPKIIYGVVPTEPADSWRQLEPGEGALPPDIRGKHIKVEVSTRLDGWFGVGHQSTFAEFDVPR